MKQKGLRHLVLILAIVAAAAILAVSLAFALGGPWTVFGKWVAFRGHLYRSDLENLDLRDQRLTAETYDALRARMPGCRILWNVPFGEGTVSSDVRELKIQDLSEHTQNALAYLPDLERIDGTACGDLEAIAAFEKAHPEIHMDYLVSVDGETYPQDTETLTVSHLTEEDLGNLSYLPALRTVNAEGCTDYPVLLKLRKENPELEVSYSVELFGEKYPSSTKELTLADPDVEVLTQMLPYLTELQSLHLTQSTASAQALCGLKEALPEINVTWDKTILGQAHSSEDTEFDFSGMELTLEEVEEGMRYFPNAGKVILSDCGIDNETMAAFREKMRDSYKVVWTIIATGQRVRTDDTVFHAAGRHISMDDRLSEPLKYCEDMVVMDVGHSRLKHIEWVKGMPHLKYLILSDNLIQDISPVAYCKELVYFEAFINEYPFDVTPLQQCPKLEDVSLSNTCVDVTPLAKMPWLKNLWLNNVKLPQETKDLLTESLPNTRINFGQGSHNAGGWRKLQNYYDMRDLMGMPYFYW